MIGILDYGMGNLYSVSAALQRLDTSYVLTDNHAELEKTDGLIVPGVGSFRDAMEILQREGHVEFIYNYVKSRPLFGICLGMQLLFESSEENGPTDGLRLLPGEVVRFKGENDRTGETYKVPHMGWNQIAFQKPESVLLKEAEEDYVYFVHSYKVIPKTNDVLTATADYHGSVPAVVEQGRVFGAQFHPEKSGRLGMKLLKNFVEYAQTR